MTDTFEQVVNQIQQQFDDFHVIKYEGKDYRLFKSLANRRLEEFGETFDEYKVRLKINSKMVKKHKQGLYESSTSNI